MKRSTFFSFLILFSFCFSTSFSSLFAQGGVTVVSQTESFSQATYQLQDGNRKVEVTLRKQQGQVDILLKSKNGEVLGKGNVKNDGNGNPLISILETRTGTHAIWEFVLERVIPDGNSTSLSPRKKAYAKCQNRCEDFVKNHEGWNILTVSNGNQSVSMASLKQVQKALQAYQTCLWKCMKEAKDRNQN